jgi:hypothetical protein
MEGTLTFTSDGPVSAIALRINESSSPVNIYTPIVDPYQANNRPVVIPQFVDGGGWTTHVFLVNPTEDTIAGEIRLFKNGEPGQPGVPSEIATEQGLGSVFPYSIPPRGQFILAGRGETGDIGVMFAEIVPTEGRWLHWRMQR